MKLRTAVFTNCTISGGCSFFMHVSDLRTVAPSCPFSDAATISYSFAEVSLLLNITQKAWSVLFLGYKFYIFDEMAEEKNCT